MIAIFINNDAREAVGFTPDKTAEREIDVDSLAIGNGLTDSSGEKFLIQLLKSSRDASGDDLGVGIIYTAAERSILEVFQGN